MSNRLDQAIKLLEYALHLRMRGECAPGGSETWAEFDRRCEAFLRKVGTEPAERPGLITQAAINMTEADVAAFRARFLENAGMPPTVLPHTPDVDYLSGAVEALALVADRIADAAEQGLRMGNLDTIREILEGVAAELGADEDAPSSPLSASLSAQESSAGGSGRPEPSTALSGGCDCGHDGQAEMFHTRPCLIAERRIARRAAAAGMNADAKPTGLQSPGRDLTPEEYEEFMAAFKDAFEKFDGPADSCTCKKFTSPDPACPVHHGRRARGPKPPPLGPGCVCDGSGRTCPRHGTVI